MKSTFKMVCVVLFTLVLSNINAKEKNFLNSAYYSFEMGDNSAFIQYPNLWSVSDEKDASDGIFSLKYHSSVSAADQSKVNITEDASLVSFPAGDYTLKAKVWLSSDAEITGFRFILKEPWEVITVNFPSDIKKEEWVEISLPLSGFVAYDNSATLIKMESSFGGKGTLYIDDIGIWGIDNTPETIPDNSSIQNSENTISLPAGIYDVNLSVWLDENSSISKFYSTIEEPWTNLEWDISKIAKGEWVNLTQKVTLKQDISASPFMIQLSNLVEYGGGKGSVYVDEINYIYLNDVKVKTPISINYKVYPNPTSDILNIESDKPVDYFLYSTSGSLMLQSSLKKTNHIIHVGNQKSGMYLLKLQSDKGKVVKSIIIK